MLVTLDNGLQIECNPDKFNDMRVLELMASDDELAYPRLVNMVLEKEQKLKIYDFLEKENGGRIPVEKFAEVFNELVLKMGKQSEEVKN